MKITGKMLLSSIVFGVIVFLTQGCGKDSASKSAKGGVTSKTGQQSTTSAGGSTATADNSSNLRTAGDVVGETQNPSPGNSGGAAGDICVDSDDEFSNSPKPGNEAPDDLFACRKAAGSAVWHCKVDLDGSESTTNDRPIIDVAGSASDTGFSCDGVDSLPFQ